MVPSGSVEADAFAVTESGAFPVDGVTVRAATGNWFGGCTVIVVVAEPVSVFAAVNVTECVPTCPDAGVQESVPAVFSDPAVKVAPEGRPDAVRDVMASPSGSAAVTATVIRVPARPEAVAGAVTTGARSALFTVTTVLAEPVRALAAVKITVYEPDWVSSGVQVNVPLRLSPAAVNAAPAGTSVAVSEVIASPSGSEALTRTVSSSFSCTAAVAGAVTTGA